MGDLWLVRHAEAAAPDDERLPGPDLPLTERGRGQAALLAERLAACRPAAVLCSDALRARQTAGVVGARCGVPVAVRPELREVGFGAWAGRTYAEVVAGDPEAERYFRDPTAGVPPGGERVEDAATRVLTALREAADAHPTGAVVVGHGGSLRLALAAGLGMPLGAYWRLRLEPASVSACSWSEAGLVLRTMNVRCHLDTPAEGRDR